MQPILTQCPRCQTSFKVSDKQLAIAEGMVRCGSCLDVFSALANRITLKQPVSAIPPDDPVDEDFAHENELQAQTPPEYNLSLDEVLQEAPQEILQNSTIQSSVADTSNNYTSTYSETPYEGGNQTAFSTSSTAPVSYTSSEELEFVLDDERGEVSLGDMMLDEMELDDHAYEFEHDDQDEPDSVDESEDDADSGYANIYEEYTETNEQPPVDDNVFEEAPATSPAPAFRYSKPDTASYEDALTADDDLDNSFDEEFVETADITLTELVAEFSAGQQRAPQFAEPIIDNTNTHSYHAGSVPADSFLADSYENPTPFEQNFVAEATPEFQQYPLGDADLQASPTVLHPVNNPVSDVFVLDTEVDIFPGSPTIANERVTGSTLVNPADQYERQEVESPYDFDVTATEEPQEAGGDDSGEHHDYEEHIAAADSFTANNFSDTDELHVPGFSALTVDETDEAELAVPAPRANTQRDKEEMRQYLAELEDSDALEPLPATMMDTIEADPLTLEIGHAFRKYVTTFGWFCLSLVLLAVFVLQVVSSNLELMQKSPLYSRYLPLFCNMLDCPKPEPATAGIENLQSQDLLVRSHPRIADALEVSFIFRNDAEIPLAFPLIELNFRNSNKVLIANRLFNPEEYLPPELAALDMMPARSSVQVMLELADPGSEAVDYAITFRELQQ